MLQPYLSQMASENILPPPFVTLPPLLSQSVVQQENYDYWMSAGSGAGGGCLRDAPAPNDDSSRAWSQTALKPKERSYNG